MNSFLRKLFDDFDHSSIAKFTEKKIILLRSSSSLLSEQKIRAAVENARLIKKVSYICVGIFSIALHIAFNNEFTLFPFFLLPFSCFFGYFIVDSYKYFCRLLILGAFLIELTLTRV